jgi:hypothetical protein
LPASVAEGRQRPVSSPGALFHFFYKGREKSFSGGHNNLPSVTSKNITTKKRITCEVVKNKINNPREKSNDCKAGLVAW